MADSDVAVMERMADRREPRILSEDPLDGHGARKRILIGTSDIAGPIKNGGIGTAYSHAARFLAAEGHHVTILFVHNRADDPDTLEKARALYTPAGVRFVGAKPRPGARTPLAATVAPSYAMYNYLRSSSETYDIVHCSEWRGVGYISLLAKHLGLEFADTHFVVKCSSPTLWNAEGNEQFLRGEGDLGLAFMERRSVELADTVISGSAHMLDWMRRAHYALPERSFVWPNIFPGPEEPAAGTDAPLEEVVFFGRLEPRKGLVLFVDAINYLAKRGETPKRITFLGGKAARFDGPGLIDEAKAKWPGAEVRLLTGKSATEAIAYLRKPGRLAVIPSLLENSSMAIYECLAHGVPFVAAATGGSPELVHASDAPRALVRPHHIDLAQRIQALETDGLSPIRPRWDPVASHKVWSDWHAAAAAFRNRAAEAASIQREVWRNQPKVTVCITHYERPRLLAMALDSVRRQDWPNFNVVLVDDGSASRDAVDALDALESEFAQRGWRMVRQENRYLGAARNAAALAADGEYLLFLDDDNVLMEHALTKLVRAAQYADLDVVTAGGRRFRGDGDPRVEGDVELGTPLRFLGPARAWNMYRNVVGDACALIRRDVFLKEGGYTEHYRVGLDDLEFYNRLMASGRQIEHLPQELFYYRLSEQSMKKQNRSIEQGRFRAVSPSLMAGDSEERALYSYSIAQRDNNSDTAKKSGGIDRMVSDFVKRLFKA